MAVAKEAGGCEQQRRRRHLDVRSAQRVRLRVDEARVDLEADHLAVRGHQRLARVGPRQCAALEVGDVVISVRDASNNNLDFPMFWATLKPNETKTFQTSRNLASGIYHITSTVHHYLYGWGPTYLLTTNKDYTL